MQRTAHVHINLHTMGNTVNKASLIRASSEKHSRPFTLHGKIKFLAAWKTIFELTIANREPTYAVCTQDLQ